MSEQKPSVVAIFDFDHTLIRGDSFWPYLIHAAGIIPFLFVLVMAVASLLLLRVRGDKTTETRTYLKGFLIRSLLKGKRLNQLHQAAISVRQWQEINPTIMKALREHHAKGAKIVIASGGLNLYLPEMLRGIPYDALICTDIGMLGGTLSGEMIHGNCVRQTKAQRVAAWLEANGPFDESWAYGNYPHDVPMMALVKHRIIVS